MKVEPSQFNQAEADRLISTAQRTIDIIDLLKAGKEDKEVMQEVNCERSLVYYYIKVLTKERS